MTTQAQSVAVNGSQINTSGVMQVAGGGTGLSAVGTSGYVLASNGSANVYVSAVGYSGYSGYSGTNGSNGASGTSGYSGATGSNGSAGTSGYSGYSGAAGTPSTSYNTVGSYALGLAGQNSGCYAAGTLLGGISTLIGNGNGCALLSIRGGGTAVSGSWRTMTRMNGACGSVIFLAVRVS
jgi:Collagen triple helix repeat (20 copies)